MPSEKLTKAKIRDYRYQGGGQSRDVRWDGGDGAVKGLGVRIYPSGKKSFVLSYRDRGQKQLMVIGDVSAADLTLDKVRRRAGKHLDGIRDGKNPLEEKRTAGRGKTLGDLIDAFMDNHVVKQAPKTSHAIRLRLNRNIPAAWKSRRADAIKTTEIEDLHKHIGKTRPYEANRLLENLRTMYRHAPRWKYTDRMEPPPTDGIKKFREHKRKRWVKPEELPALARAIDGEPNVYVRAAIWLYLLTGVRKSELLQARWNDVDWNRGTLALPETKSGEEQQATLSGPALAILQGIPRLDKNPYILPGRVPQQHLVNVHKCWLRIREQATMIVWSESDDAYVPGLVKKLTERMAKQYDRAPTVAEVQIAAALEDIELPVGALDVRLHDLRRTTGSWLSQHGADLNLVKDALRHQSISTTITYARLAADSAREAMEDHGRRILEAAGALGPREVAGDDAKE